MSVNSVKLTYYQRNKDALLQKSNEYYQNNKDKRNKYKEINKYQRNRYNNMSKEEKDKLNEYHRRWYSNLDDNKRDIMKKNVLDRYYSLKAH